MRPDWPKKSENLRSRYLLESRLQWERVLARQPEGVVWRLALCLWQGPACRLPKRCV